MKLFLKNIGFIVILFFAMACAGGGQSSMSCGSLSSGSNASGESVVPGSESPNFSTSEPIDIPVPIAKGVEPVDATQFRFSVNGGNGNLNQGLVQEGAMLAAGVTTVIEGKTQVANVTVDGYLDGDIVCTDTAGADRSFTCTVDGNACGSAILFIVRGSNGTGSYPVTFICDAADNVIDSEYSNQFITNITGIQTDALAASDVYASYCARTNTGEFLMARSPIIGGFPERLTDDDELAECMTNAGFANDGTFLFGLDSLSNVFYSPLSTGAVSDLGDSDGDVRVTTDDAYFTTSIDNGGTLVLQNIDVSTGTATQIIVSPETVVDVMEIAPTPGNVILVMKEFNDATNEAQLYDLSSTIGTNTTTVPTVLFSSACRMRNPQINPATGTDFVYECLDGGNVRSLYFSDGVAQTEIASDADGLTDINNCTWTTDGEFVVCDAIPDEDPTTRILFAYEFDTDTVTRLFYGEKPRGVPSYAEVFVYLSEDTTGTLQVGVHNLALDSRFN